MEDFSKILDKAKELENKIKESQEKIKKIKAEGISGSNSVKVTLNGEGDITKIELSQEVLKEEKNTMLAQNVLIVNFGLILLRRQIAIL